MRYFYTLLDFNTIRKLGIIRSCMNTLESASRPHMCRIKTKDLLPISVPDNVTAPHSMTREVDLTSNLDNMIPTKHKKLSKGEFQQPLIL